MLSLLPVLSRPAGAAWSAAPRALGVAVHLVIGVVTAIVAATSLPAQDIPERLLAGATAELRTGLKSARLAHELPDGRLLLADLLGGALQVADLSTGVVESRMRVGEDDEAFRTVGAFWRWPADSVAFIDGAKGRLTILTPDGRYARSIALGEAPAATMAGAPSAGAPGGTTGQPPGPRALRPPVLRYLVSPTVAIGVGIPPRVAPPTAMAPPVRMPYPVVRVDLGTSTVDTILQLLPPQQPRSSVMNPTAGSLSLFAGTESLQSVDTWAALSDGTVVVVRAGGYRLDLIAPDGSRTTAGPIAFPRIAVTEGDRKRITAAFKRAMTDQIAANPRMAAIRLVLFEEPSSWPVTHPPFRGDVSARVDRRDHMWLSTRCAKLEQATCYDVISREGVRVMRVRLPEKSTLLGFGNDAIYTTTEEKGGKLVVQRYPNPLP